ncbi:hypothetical protein EV121DRAFT_204892 [Schizophyllum commune]
MPNMRPFPPTHGFIGPDNTAWLQEWTREITVLFVFMGIHAAFYILSTHLLVRCYCPIRDNRTGYPINLWDGAKHSRDDPETEQLANREQYTAQSKFRSERHRRCLAHLCPISGQQSSSLVSRWLPMRDLLCEPHPTMLPVAVAANTVLVVITIVNQRTDQSTSILHNLLLTVPLLVTNLTATGLMGWKAWTHREFVCDSFLHRKHKSRAELALLLLVESGLAYCAVWVVVMISGLGTLPDTQRSTLLGALCSICGAYPTFIVIMVGLQRSSVDSVLAGNSALVPLTPGPRSGTSKGMSAEVKARFSSREKVSLYGVNRSTRDGNPTDPAYDEQYAAFMMPMSPTRQSWPFAVPPTGPPRHVPNRRASSPPGAPVFGRLVRVPERSSSLAPSMGSPGASMVSPTASPALYGMSSSLEYGSPMPHAAMSPSPTFSALDPMSDVPLMSSAYGGYSRQTSYGGHSRSSSDAPLLGPGNGMHSRSSSDAPLLGSFNDNRNSMEETSFLDMASSDGGHTSTPASRFVEFPTPAPTSARPDFPEASARKKDSYRLSYPTMAWTDSSRASVKDTRKGFVRLSTVDEA